MKNVWSTNLDRGLTFFVLSFSGGIFSMNYAEKFLQNSFPLWLLGPIFLIVAGAVFYKTRKLRIGVILLAFILGMSLFSFFIPQALNPELAGREVQLRGKIAESYPQSNTYVIEISTINEREVEGKTRAVVRFWGENAEKLAWGEVVSLSGRIEALKARRNPGGFSEEDYWHSRGVSFKLNGREASLRRLEAPGGLQLFSNKLRNRVTEIIGAHVPEEEKGLLLALLLGDKSFLPLELYESAQRAGIAHIFAVSGLHVGILLAFFLTIAWVLGLSRKQILLVCSLLLGSYALLTGFTPSVLRASVMSLLALFAYTYLYYRDSLSLLSVAALIILLLNPYNLFSIGFQLSFLTAAGIILAAPFFYRFFGKWPKWFKGILAVAIAAQLFSWPVIAYYFNSFSPWTLLFNIVFVPLLVLIVPLIFLGVFVGLIFSPLATPFIYAAGSLIYLIASIIEKTQDYLPWSSFNLKSPSLLFLGFYYALVFGLIYLDFFARKYRRESLIALSLMLLALIVLQFMPLRDFRIYFLDVGQGDSAVIFNEGEVVVIDGGPGAETLSSFLAHRGVNRIKLVVLSHPDEDHIRGLYKVFAKFEVEYLLLPEYPTNEQQLELEREAVARGTGLLRARDVEAVFFKNGAELRVLSDERQAEKGNDASLVTLFSYEDLDILFTGDMGKDYWSEILPLEGIEILKVPHHGSRNSWYDGVYAAFQTEAAIISAGINNRYGHPHQEVLRELGEQVNRIFRTDQAGAIILEKSNAIYRVTTFLP